MTALLEYLDLLCDAWEAKLLHAKQKERSFLTYLIRILLSYVFILKSTRPCEAGTRDYPDLRALLRAGYVTRIKLTCENIVVKS